MWSVICKMIEIKSTKYTILDKSVFCFHILKLQDDLTQSYCVCMKRITLCNCLYSSSSCFSASLIRNIAEFGAKNYFTDPRTANTWFYRSISGP